MGCERNALGQDARSTRLDTPGDQITNDVYEYASADFTILQRFVTYLRKP